MSNDIELQLSELTIQVPESVNTKKENECLYLCKKCKWNVAILFLTIGLIVENGINIKIIIDQKNDNKESVEYLTICSIIQCITWVNYLIYYTNNNIYILYLLTTSGIGLNTIICWGDHILLTYMDNNINTVIMINKILVLWYQLFVFFQYIYFLN